MTSKFSLADSIIVIVHACGKAEGRKEKCCHAVGSIARRKARKKVHVLLPAVVEPTTRRLAALLLRRTTLRPHVHTRC